MDQALLNELIKHILYNNVHAVYDYIFPPADLSKCMESIQCIATLCVFTSVHSVTILNLLITYFL